MKFKSLIHFLNYFRNETICIKYLEKKRFSQGEFCPHCGTFCKLYRIKSGYKCSSCRKTFTIKYGTIFSRSHISLKTWFTAIFLLSYHTKGISSVQLAKDLGVTSLKYQLLDDMVKAIGLPKEKLCLYCWNGKGFQKSLDSY